ncbi:hypothetical protein B0H34DRAFT_796193 [Crassisporium funariophilum]|nr:hypothetical protein B0H34DRAFT_796193 [Crassisporium funariophilum]
MSSVYEYISRGTGYCTGSCPIGPSHLLPIAFPPLSFEWRIISYTGATFSDTLQMGNLNLIVVILIPNSRLGLRRLEPHTLDEAISIGHGVQDLTFDNIVYSTLNDLAVLDIMSSVFEYTSEEYLALLCYPASQESALLLQILRNANLPIEIQWRLYESLSTNLETQMIRIPHILGFVAMTPEPESEQDFNKWYTEEHIPMLSRTPTWISSNRYSLVACSLDAPQYLALHAWGSRTTFDSQAYSMATSTHWRTQVMDKIIKRERFIFDYVSEVDRASAEGLN